MASIRPPAVAGTFYPADPRMLAAQIDAMLAAVDNSQPPRPDATPPKALIVPHAGYVYSGPVAASAYARITAAHSRIRRVVLLGPVHQVAVRGLALPGIGDFATPLGTVRIDAEALARLRALPQVTESPDAHRLEHSLEVHLPFLQRLLDDFTLVPLAVGDARPEDVAHVLDAVWGGNETLIVISSDLSHYLPYEHARAQDAQTAALIVARRSGIGHDQACGATPLNGLTLCAQRRAVTIELVDLRNSGDTAGGRDRVVGYGSFVCSEPTR